jgi:predicted  nucleic acid-binding Zn-ribbon protein
MSFHTEVDLYTPNKCIGEKEASEVPKNPEDFHFAPMQAKCQEITDQPVANLLVNLGICSICLDTIVQTLGVSTTRCGHTFHSHCFLRVIRSGSGNCPNCRSPLIAIESDDEDKSIYDSDEDEDENNEDNEDEDNRLISEIVTLEQTATKLQNMGYSVADILAFYVGTTIRSETPQKYNLEFFMKINEDLDGILDGRIPLSQRDTRSYSEALTGRSTGTGGRATL